MLGAEVNDTIEVLETRLLEHSRVHIILEVTIVEWQTKTVETQGSKVLGVFITDVISPPSIGSRLVFQRT
jgi:nucleoid-associated protein YejK